MESSHDPTNQNTASSDLDQWEWTSLVSHPFRPDYFVFVRFVEEKYLVGTRTEGWSELLVTPAPVSQPALITVTISTAVLPQVESLTQGFLSTDPALQHIATLSVVQHGEDLGSTRIPVAPTDGYTTTTVQLLWQPSMYVLFHRPVVSYRSRHVRLQHS